MAICAPTQIGPGLLLDSDEFAYTKNNWAVADHVQVWTGSAGVSYLWYGTRFSADLIYGSGLRAGFANTDHVPSYAQVNAGLSREFDIVGWNPITLRFDVINVFDTSYVLRNDTGIGVFGSKFGPRRGYYFGVAQKFGPGASTKKKPPAASRWVSIHPSDAVWTWTGFYIGGNLGYSASRFGTDTVYSDLSAATPLAATTSSIKHYGALGGGQTGFNWQWGMWLVGIETDMQFAHQRTTTGSGCPGSICNPAVPFEAPVTLIHQHNLDWLGTLRGRLGMAVMPHLLTYVTGGLAYGEVEHVGTIYGSGLDDMGNPIFAGNNFISRQLRAGWTAGAGIEARLAGNVTGKIEYLHVDFGSDTAPTSSPQNARPIAIDFRSRITEDLVRLGLNYKFDPYVAVYKIAAPVSKSSERSPVIYKAPVTALWTWTGYYLGINAGYSWGRSRTEGIFNDSVAGTASATSSSFRLDGKVFGIQTGYNFQFGSLLLGIEADAQLTGQRANPTFMCPATICNPGGPVVAAFDQSQKLEWFATLRARFGIAVTPHAIMYVTGGAAVAGLMTSGTLFGFDPTGATPISNPFGNITINAGWTVGGGVETHLCGNWAGKVEYLYVNLGSMTTNQNNQQSGMTLTAAFNSRMSDQIARVGLNYKFD